MTWWSAYITDRLIAPEMSKFTAATIRDMSAVDPEQEYWLANFILNTAVRVKVSSPHRQQLYNFLRRSHSAFAEYEMARAATLAYLGDRQRQLRYVEAIGHWEAFLGTPGRRTTSLDEDKPCGSKREMALSSSV